MTDISAREALLGTIGGPAPRADRLLTPGEVAALFRVDPRTPGRWAAAGRISAVRTPGGHRRFRESEIRALLGPEKCERCDTAAAGTCCSTHEKKLCHRCYRRTHFVEVCVEGCRQCAAEGLPVVLAGAL